MKTVCSIWDVRSSRGPYEPHVGLGSGGLIACEVLWMNVVCSCAFPGDVFGRVEGGSHMKIRSHQSNDFTVWSHWKTDRILGSGNVCFMG